MTALNKQALHEKIKSKREFFDTQTIIDVDVLEALLDESHRVTAERDALRENIGGDNTRAIFTGKCLGQGMFVATYDDDGFFDYWEGMEIIGVTHWMPLPAPPQQ